MTPRGGPSAGVTLVEVLVALTVLAINAVAISGTLLLAIDLTGRVERIAALLDEGVALPACGLALAPWPRLRRRSPGGRRGFTLIEVLVALALAGVVGAAAVGFLAASARTSTVITARLVDQEARIAIPAILGELVALAGEGVDAPACALGVEEGGGRLVIMRAARDGSLRVDEVFAAKDGGGRPALYWRQRPFPRQPWLEDVASFEVARLVHASDGRVGSLDLRVGHLGSARPILVTVPLPHRPCLEGAP